MPSVAAAILTCDQDDRIVGFRDPTGSFDYTASELWEEPRTRVLLPSADDLAVSQRPPDEVVRSVWVRKDGRPLPVTVRAQPALDANGNVAACCYVIQARNDDAQVPRESLVAARDSRRDADMEELLGPYRTIAHQLPNGAVIVVGRNLSVRVAAGPLFQGSTQAGLEGGPVRELPLDRGGDLVEAGYRKALQGEASRCEASVCGRDVVLSCSPVRDGEGRIVAAMGLAWDISETKRVDRDRRERDVTERKSTERVLRQWADAFEHCAHGIAMGDPVTGVLRVVNPALANMLGRSVEEVAGMSCLSLYAPSEHERVADWNMGADAEEHVRFESVMVKADGSPLPVEVDLVSVRDTDGTPLYRIATVQNIEDRKRAEHELRVLSSQMESAVEAAALGVWVHDVASDTVWGNDMQNRLWGLDRPAFVPFPRAISAAAIHPEDRERAAEVLGECATRGTKLVTQLRVVRRTDGKTRWLAVRASPELDEQGQVVRLLGVTIDVTEQKLANEALLRSQKLEALGRLSGGIAHDFNNILQAVLGYADLGLEKCPNGHPAHALFDEIAIAATRAVGLVRQILTFSRPREQTLRPVQLGGMVNEALQLLRATLPASVVIRADVSDALPCVHADPTQVHQVLVNLLTNAAHAIGPSPGSIEIGAEYVELGEGAVAAEPEIAPGAYVVLSVRDDGHGMDEETLARVFDPFFTTKARGQGTGLGLSVVHGIMRGLGGGVAVSSEAGLGATFQLHFPVALRPTSSQETLKQVSQGRGRRILFVDDERALASLGKQALEHVGYAVDAFDDPVEALKAYRERPTAYAAVVTDLAMPGMTGFELASVVLSDAPRLPVLLMSGNLGPEERTRAEGVGVRTCLAKPLSMGELSARLDAVLRE